MARTKKVNTKLPYKSVRGLRTAVVGDVATPVASPARSITAPTPAGVITPLHAAARAASRRRFGEANLASMAGLMRGPLVRDVAITLLNTGADATAVAQVPGVLGVYVPTRIGGHARVGSYPNHAVFYIRAKDDESKIYLFDPNDTLPKNGTHYTEEDEPTDYEWYMRGDYKLTESAVRQTHMFGGPGALPHPTNRALTNRLVSLNEPTRLGVCVALSVAFYRLCGSDEYTNRSIVGELDGVPFSYPFGYADTKQRIRVVAFLASRPEVEARHLLLAVFGDHEKWSRILTGSLRMPHPALELLVEHCGFRLEALPMGRTLRF